MDESGQPTAEIPVAPPTGPTPDLPAPPPPAPRRRVPLLLVAVAIIVIVAIVTGVVVASTGGGTKAAPAKREPSASPTIGSPLGFQAGAATNPFGVTLSWSAPSGTQPILGYRIYRNGVQVAAVPSTPTTYSDSNVVPGKEYTYEILTRGNDFLESDRVSTTVRVPFPALSLARLEGNFNVKLHTVSQSGFIETIKDFTVGWNFVPKCREGPCAVVWKDLTEKTLRATLKRKGVTYFGSDQGKFLGRCGSVAEITTVSIKFHVAKARVFSQEWRASKLVGTLTERHPSELGCVSGGATFSITATLIA